MNEVAFFVQVLEPKYHLPSNALYKTWGDPLTTILFDECEEILTEWLKDNADMGMSG